MAEANAPLAAAMKWRSALALASLADDQCEMVDKGAIGVCPVTWRFEKSWARPQTDRALRRRFAVVAEPSGLGPSGDNPSRKSL